MIAQTFRPKFNHNSAIVNRRNIETGFPSPATDHLEERLNLHDFVVKHPVSTFFSQVTGDEESGLGLKDGDILVIDRSLAPKQNSLVIADVDGEFRVCRLLRSGNSWKLETGSGHIVQLSLEFDMQSPIWGRITHIIHSV
jgi:DNA polymerase V